MLSALEHFYIVLSAFEKALYRIPSAFTKGFSCYEIHSALLKALKKVTARAFIPHSVSIPTNAVIQHLEDILSPIS